MSNPIPEKLINTKVYRSGVHLVGAADAKLPSIEAMTETIKGAGIAGEVDSPTLGHYKSMTVELNFRHTTPEFMTLAVQQAHELDLRGAVQVYDAAAGKFSVKSIKVVIRAFPKKTDLGKLDSGTKQEPTWEGEVVYLKVFLDGQEKIEIDKYNFISKVDGVDQLADVRSALGM